jgi:hypothetical protein
MTWESELLVNSGGNMLTMVLVGLLYVMYQRCLSCNSSCHTGFFDCTSKEVRNAKDENKISVLIKALERHDKNTSRNSGENLL